MIAKVHKSLKIRRTMNVSKNNDDEVSSGVAPDYASQEKHLHEWDPMKGASQSLLNSTDSEGSILQRMFTGIGDINQEDALCPFNDGSGRCYKLSCRYKHVPYSSKVLNELPKLHTAVSSKKEPLCIYSSLPAQVLPATGCISKVVVTAVSDPDHFYLVPENGWKCLCVTHEKDLKNEFTDHPVAYNFYDALGKIQGDIQHFQRQGNQRKKNEFVAGELVAVRLQADDGSKAWYRAKVLSDTLTYCDDEEDIFKPVDVTIQLLDYGVSYVKSSVDIIYLPEDLANIGPMAYKCRLNGISPIMGIWGTTAIKRFKEMVNHQCVIAEVVRTGSLLAGKDDPCVVSLYVKSQDNNYADAAQRLINSGLGVNWS